MPLLKVIRSPRNGDKTIHLPTVSDEFHKAVAAVQSAFPRTSWVNKPSGVCFGFDMNDITKISDEGSIIVNHKVLYSELLDDLKESILDNVVAIVTGKNNALSKQVHANIKERQAF